MAGRNADREKLAQCAKPQRMLTAVVLNFTEQHDPWLSIARTSASGVASIRVDVAMERVLTRQRVAATMPDIGRMFPIIENVARMPRNGNHYSLLTLEKGFGALELIAASPRDLGVSELSERLNEPISVTFRVVRTLMELGYVNQDSSTKRYSLGLRAWELGERAAARLDVRGVVQPVLDRLTSATGETASFALVQGTEYCYVATSDGLQPLRAYVERGSRLSLATPSASARTILAFSAHHVVDAVLAGKLKRHTATTVIEPARIRAMLVETRHKGVGVVHGENQQQLSAVAAPVHNANGQCIGAIALSGLTLRFQGEALKRMVQLVRAESKDVEARLAFPGRSAQRDESSDAQVAVLRPKRARRR